MDMKRIGKMVDNITENNNVDPLNEIDSAIDVMITASQTIEENVKNIDTQNENEKKAVANIIEIIETAINPYLANIIEEMEKFEEEQ